MNKTRYAAMSCSPHVTSAADCSHIAIRAKRMNSFAFIVFHVSFQSKGLSFSLAGGINMLNV